MFITFEGLDCSGKTTIIKMLEKKLNNNNFNILVTREPGGNLISEQIRKILLNKNNNNMDGWTEALLYIASRRQHLAETVIPALKANKIVISDRFLDSTTAYQGAGRDIEIEDLDFIQKKIINNYLPNLTLFLDVSIKTMEERIKLRDEKELNRLDLENQKFYDKVRIKYLNLAKNNSRIKVINANNSINQVFDECLKYINNLLKDFPRGN